MFNIEKCWKDIEEKVEYGYIQLVGLVVFGIIFFLSLIVKMPPSAISITALLAMFLFAVIRNPKQVEKKELNKAIEILKNRLEDFRKKFLNRGESDSFFSLSKNPPKKEYPDELWKKYHEWRFAYLTLGVDHINRQITGPLNKQEISSCFKDLFNMTNRCHVFLNEYVREMNEQGDLPTEHEEIVDVYNKFKDDLFKDVERLNTDLRSFKIDVGGIKLQKIRLSDLQ